MHGRTRSTRTQGHQSLKSIRQLAQSQRWHRRLVRFKASALFLLFLRLNALADWIDANAGSAIVTIDPATGAESTLSSAPSGFQGISTFDVVGRRLLYTTSTGTGTALVSVNIDARTVTE